MLRIASHRLSFIQRAAIASRMTGVSDVQSAFFTKLMDLLWADSKPLGYLAATHNFALGPASSSI